MEEPPEELPPEELPPEELPPEESPPLLGLGVLPPIGAGAGAGLTTGSVVGYTGVLSPPLKWQQATSALVPFTSIQSPLASGFLAIVAQSWP